MRTENTARTSRLLRVREFTDKVIKKTPKTSTNKRKSRFVAPYYFNPEEQQAIEEVLVAAGISDQEGRKLFVTAAEYEVGSLRPALQQESIKTSAPTQTKPQSKAQIELLQLGQSAAQLRALLKGTHKTARSQLGQALSASDPFGREHGPVYLEHLELELARIAGACAGAMAAPEPEPASPHTTPGANAKKLIKQMARIYGECLEADPAAAGARELCAILCIIKESAELPIPCDPDMVNRLLS